MVATSDGKAWLPHGTGTGTGPIPVPVPTVPGAVPTHCRPVAVLVWNGIGTDRSSNRYGRSSGRCCPFPFPFLAVPVPVLAVPFPFTVLGLGW